MYLALIIDAYSKKNMGYDLSSSLGTDGSVRTLKNEMMHRQDKIIIKVYKKSHQRGTPLMRHNSVFILSNK